MGKAAGAGSGPYGTGGSKLAPAGGGGPGGAARERPHRERGFTMLELVCVLALLALLMGLVLPGMQRSWQRGRERASLRQLASTLRVARSEAATLHRRIRVFLDLDTNRYRLEESGQQGQMAGMRLVEAHLVWQDAFKRQGYIAFYGDGSSSGGQVTLVDSLGRRHWVGVETITGKVTLKSGGT
jgi:general secretion pathway protein H